MRSKQKRPVYVVTIPTGNFIGGEEAKIIVGIRQTRAGADFLANSTVGAIVEKQFLVAE